MDVAEQLTQRFITSNGLAKSGLAMICPQFELVRESGWRANFDFLVLDFGAETGAGGIIVVEVSDSHGLGSAGEKADLFKHYSYRQYTAEAVDCLTHDLTRGWPVYFLGIVRDASAAQLGNTRYDESWISFRSLHELVTDDWWGERMKGLLPGIAAAATT